MRTRPPQRSTLFPYTTLFRSSAWLRVLAVTEKNTVMLRAGEARRNPGARCNVPCPGLKFYRLERETYAEAELRSEEHTSELQSLRHLVCRLLLEKKKNIMQSD